MGFIRNIWYVAMWSQNLKVEQPVGRTFLNEPVVLFRTAEGKVSALGGICPHRFAPLHMGAVKGDRLVCGYHGLAFDETGACVNNPHGNGRIPPAARVRSYPVAEKHSLIWIWMGEDRADPALIPDFGILDPESGLQISRRDWLLMDASWELITDNLLDLSHTAFLHVGILGSEETIRADLKMEETANSLIVRRSVPNAPVPGFFDLMYKRDQGRVDLWADITWYAPGCMSNDTGVTEPGRPRSEGTGIFGTHFLTPETETSTYYHFAAARQNPISWGEPLDTEIQKQVADLRRYAFEHQDQVMIREQQKLMLQYPESTAKPAMLEIDIGPVRYRRIMDSLRKQRDSVPTAAE